MGINFPNSPTNGQTTTVGNTTYSYNSTVGAWEIVSSGGIGTMTTKGDLLSRSSTGLSRIGVGTNDYVLTADSAATPGISWGTAPKVVSNTAARPGSPYVGQIIYQNDINQVLLWTGSAWVIINSPSAISIDSGNRVSTPLAPSVSASRSSDLSYNNSAQNVPIVFNQTSHNIGNHYSTSTGLLTAPIAGDYFVSCGVYNAGNVDVSQLWGVINGSRSISIVLSSSGGSSNLAGSGIFRLNVNDTFGMAAWFGGASVTITSNSFHTFLRIRYLG